MTAASAQAMASLRSMFTASSLELHVPSAPGFGPWAPYTHKNAAVHRKLVGRVAIYWPDMAEIPTSQRLAAVREQLEPLTASVDVEALESKAAALEGEMGAPGFWDDQERAAKVS